MQSLQQLLYLALYFYLGSFTHITYDTIFFYQKKLLLIKHIIFFSFIAFLWISIANKFSIQMIYIYYIIFIVGYTISYKIFHSYITETNTIYKAYIDKFKIFLFYYIKLLLMPPLYNYIKCKIYMKSYYHKYPYLKPIGIKRLF